MNTRAGLSARQALTGRHLTAWYNSLRGGEPRGLPATSALHAARASASPYNSYQSVTSRLSRLSILSPQPVRYHNVIYHLPPAGFENIQSCPNLSTQDSPRYLHHAASHVVIQRPIPHLLSRGSIAETPLPHCQTFFISPPELLTRPSFGDVPQPGSQGYPPLQQQLFRHRSLQLPSLPLSQPSQQLSESHVDVPQVVRYEESLHGDELQRQRSRARNEQRRLRMSQDNSFRDQCLQRRREQYAQQQLQRSNEDIVANRARQTARRRPTIQILVGMGFNYRQDFNPCDISELNVGLMDKICQYCGAARFSDDRKGLCCGDGKVHFDLIEPPPEPLASLFGPDDPQGPPHPESAHFLTNITTYNICFNMTSFGVQGRRAPVRGYMPTFSIQGQIYHEIGSLLPAEGRQPSFLQVYLIGEPQIQIDRRQQIVRDTFGRDLTKRVILQLWNELLNLENHLVRDFKTALERATNDDTTIRLRADVPRPEGEHSGRYNLPTRNEIAMVIVNEESSYREICIQKRGGFPQRIQEMNPFYDAYQYPLIFWKGQSTYDFERAKYVTRLPDGTVERIPTSKCSTTKYYSYHFMYRPNMTNHLLKCRRLLLQYVVDMYIKIEAERLRFLRMNQANLRADEYNHLQDAISNNLNPEEIGRRVILPSSYIGGPRNMQEYAQDAMAYVRVGGTADLFITITCNSQWPEIVTSLLPGQRPEDRPDVTARVFNLKLKILHKILTKHEYFGKPIAYMHTVEWQKRGLPHAHILLWLQDKIRPNQIDDCISAELPDPEDDRELYDIISSFNIHTPCSRNAHCWIANDNRKCSKRFPRQFLSETQTANDGYPLYRRRSPEMGGISFTKQLPDGELYIDNRWIVPYNKGLSKMFKSHINVEYCNSVKSIKYICKYVNKGSDRAMMEQVGTVNENDEIQNYVSGRYISSGEAFWRIFEFPIHERSPAVVHLNVHLEGAQRVTFRADGTMIRHAIENPPPTKLIKFFDLCRDDPEARTLLYIEVPEHYVWKDNGKQTARWEKRQRGDTIGRIYTLPANSGEIFYLRMLLTHVRGPTSFESIRTIEGVLCATYREACQKLGLLESDNPWVEALTEATLTRTPSKIRHLFALILCFSHPSNPQELWNQFKDPMTDEMRLNFERANPDIDISVDEEIISSIYNRGLIEVEKLTLRMDNKTLLQLGMQSPNYARDLLHNQELMRERSYNIEDLTLQLEQNINLLTEEQRTAYLRITRAIDQNEGRIFFLDAPGGTGKTFLLNLILAHVRSQRKIILAVASSGIASTLLEGGRTAHSAFRIPISPQASSCSVSRDSNKGKMLRECRAIIWDECTMAHRGNVEKVDRLMQDMNANTMLMGGIVLVLAGDFRQTLPVITRGTPADQINASLKKSPLWRNVERVTLTKNMRVHINRMPGAESFSKKLMDIGNGVTPTNELMEIQITSDFCRPVASREALIEHIFPNLRVNVRDEDWICERAILAAKNVHVTELNYSIQDQLTHIRARTYLSRDTNLDESEQIRFPIEILNMNNPTGMPEHSLVLKVGSPILLLRNLDPPRLCNGTRLQIMALDRNIIQAKILTGKAKGDIVMLPRIPLITDDNDMKFKRVQFPIRLAYAITINKSQGQSMKVAGLYLDEPCFSHGQLYVACSRVGQPENLYVFCPNNRTKNIVYQEALD